MTNIERQLKEFKSIISDSQKIILKIEESLSSTRVRSGACGPDLQWSFHTDGSLIITGTGRMYHFELWNSSRPWGEFVKEIKKIIIQDGVETIGNYAFHDAENVEFVIYPNTLHTINKYGLFNVHAITEVNSKRNRIMLDILELEPVYRYNIYYRKA